MKTYLPRTDAIMLNIAIAQAKMIDMIAEQANDRFDFYEVDGKEYHDFEITNQSTGARFIFQCPKHPLYFNEFDDDAVKN